MSQEQPYPNPESLRQKRGQILDIAKAHGARNIRVFGSVAKGLQGPKSDIDLLVDLVPKRSLLDLGNIVMDLQDLLGYWVNVVEPEGLHWYIRDKVVKEAEIL